MSVFRTQAGLLEAFRRGQSPALEIVYRAHVRPVERYLRALARTSGIPELGQASAVADLLQEVFVRAFSVAGRKGYDGVRDYAPYLTTIAHNCFIDAVRARGREVLTSPSDLTITLEAQAAEPDGWCEPRTMAVLIGYLATLDATARGVYEQRFLLGQSQDQACTALGLSRGEIRTAEKHLRRGLRKALARAGISLAELAGEDHADSSTEISASPVRVRSEP